MRTTTLLTVLAIVLVLTGCGGGSSGGARTAPAAMANSTTTEPEVPESIRPTVLIVVEDTIALTLQKHLENLRKDYDTEGKDMTTVEWTLEKGRTTASDLRRLIQEKYKGLPLTGVLLLGHLPCFWVEGYYEWDTENGETFPSDIPLMDTNGYWKDSDSNGLLDTFPEAAWLEVPVSRVPTQWPGEYQKVARYLDKLHKRRTSVPTLPQTAMLFIDDSYQWQGQSWTEGLDGLFGKEFIKILDQKNNTDYDDFIEHLTSAGHRYLRLFLSQYRVDEVRFREEYGYSIYQKTEELAEKNLQVEFVNAHSGYSGRFTQEQNLGSQLLMHEDSEHCLTFIGSTFYGQLYDAEPFHAAADMGLSWGQSFRVWFNSEKKYPGDWYLFGACLQGDPTLVMSPSNFQATAKGSTALSTPQTEEEKTAEEMTRIAAKLTAINEPPPKNLGGYADYRADNPQFFND